jgi:DNA-binding transcriptional MerR regulator
MVKDVRIKEFAKHFGVTAQAVREWEKQGLIKPARDANGYRTYSEADVPRLMAALKGKRKEL